MKLKITVWVFIVSFIYFIYYAASKCEGQVPTEKYQCIDKFIVGDKYAKPYYHVILKQVKGSDIMDKGLSVSGYESYQLGGVYHFKKCECSCN